MAKYFLGSVGSAEAFRIGANGSKQLMFRATSLTDSGINVTSSQDEVRGGTGAPIQFVFSHDASVEITLTDVFWKKEYVEAQLGLTFTGNATDYYSDSNVAGAGTLTLHKTPVSAALPCSDEPAELIWYAKKGSEEWKAYAGEVGEGNVLTSADFENGVEYCVRYLINDDQAQEAWVTSNILPKELYLIITTPIYAGDSCAASNGNLAGHLTFEVPRFLLPGALDLGFSMSSNTTMSLSGKALAYASDCDLTHGSNLMRIVENIYGREWYTGLVAIYIDPAFDPATAPARIPVYGVYENGGTVLLDNLKDELSFSVSSKTITATLAITGGLSDSDSVTLTKTPTLGSGANKGVVTALA